MQQLKIQTPLYLSMAYQKVLQYANQEPQLTLGLGFGLFTIALLIMNQKKSEQQEPKEQQEQVVEQVVEEPKPPQELISDNILPKGDVEDEDTNLKIKKSDVHQQDWYRLKSRTFKTTQHRMNGFKEDHSGGSKEGKVKRNPLNRKKAFETDQEINHFTPKQKIRDLGKDSNIPNDKLFFQLYAKVANEVTDEEDD